MFVDTCGYRFNGLLHTPPTNGGWWKADLGEGIQIHFPLPLAIRWVRLGDNFEWAIETHRPQQSYRREPVCSMLFMFCLFEIAGGGSFILKLPVGAQSHVVLRFGRVNE